jgi:hypothetical protein
LLSHPLALGEIALPASALHRCAGLDAHLRRHGPQLLSLTPDADWAVLAQVRAGNLDLDLPTDAAPVRFAAKPTLEAALHARPRIPSARELSAAIRAGALTPWHLRQAVMALTGQPLLPLRAGTHHLAPDADGIAILFPPTDCARALTGLCAWLNKNPPLPVTALALVAYLQIGKLHAFHDGNGRLARLLLTAILAARLLESAELYLPLASVIFANAEYLSAEYRRATDARTLDPFLSYGTALLERVVQAAVSTGGDKTSCSNLSTEE